MMESGEGRDLVEEVRAASDIVGVVGAYVRLRKAGRSFKGLCPFHKEKTPSFMVNPERQSFHCFGCGKGGDVFRFLMEIEGVAFPEALRTLAQRAGVRLPERGDPRAREKRERLYALLDFAAGAFRSLYKGERGKRAREYARSRGFDEETEERFGFGFAPDGWRGLRDGAVRKGWSDEDLVRAGLAVPKEGGTPYDRFRNRLVFPIRNVGGRVIGFGGRILGDGEPKYLNSPETELFRKGEGLFGLWTTRGEIRGEGTAVLVEGYTDLISLWRGGVKNTVAPLGTAFTPEQARLLRNYADRAVLLFDGDEAGARAALRSLETLSAEGLQPAVAELPAGSDPDDFLRREGVEALRERINGATPVIPFLLERAYAGDREGGVRAIVQVLAAVRDEIRLGLLLQEAARLSGLNEDVLYRAVRRSRSESRDPSAEAVRLSPVRKKRVLEAERGIAYLGFEHPDLLPVIRRAVDPEGVEDLPARKLLKALYDLAERGEPPVPSLLTRTGVDRDFSRMRVESGEGEDPVPTLQDYIACVRQERIDKRVRELEKELRDAEARNDHDACAMLLTERRRLAEQKRRIAVALRGTDAVADRNAPERSEPTR
ncbi:MAG: DNA primase [Candidatus Eisenbacteria bacterium]|nr:DNA primase [Candidatus Eisenbacteria bacterium]